jgi:hypothetical protein
MSDIRAQDAAPHGGVQAIVSGSVAVAAVSAVVARVFSPSIASQSRPSVGETDERLIRIANGSLPIRWLTAAGQFLLRAWRESIAARGLARWRSAPVDRRIEFTAIVLIVAIVTHIALTGFSAPEATTAVRAVWIGIVVVLTVIATHARGVEAAWNAKSVKTTEHAPES